MPDTTTDGALGSPAEAQAAAKTLPAEPPNKGFAITSSEGVREALARSLAALQTQQTPAPPDPEPELAQQPAEAEEPPPAAATSEQDAEDNNLSESEPAEAADPEGETGEESPDGTQSKQSQLGRLLRRVNELTARNTELTAQLAEVEAQRAQKPEPPEPAAAPPPVAGPNPLANLTKPEQLQERLREAEQIVDWADNALINLEADPEQVMNEVTPLADKLGLPADRESWTPGQVKLALMKVRKQADTTARRHVPQQAQFLVERHKAEQVAAQTFDWWNNPKSPEHAVVQRSLAQFPQAAAHPAAKLAFAYMVEGHKAMLARQQAKQNGEQAKPASLPPKTPKRPAAVPSRVPAEQARLDALRQRVKTRPDSEGMTELLSMSLQQSLQPPPG